MVESAPNRPSGGREGDFSELSDWTITDIATTPGTAPEDRANAKAEIARREEAGDYDYDAPQGDVRDDLLGHGYGLEGGKVLYPTPEYKTWLESDQSEPAPQGVVRESIEDRLAAERRKIAAERQRQFYRAVSDTALQSYEDDPMTEAIRRPDSKRTSKREESSRRPGRKKLDLEIDERRRMKESNKYYSYSRDPEIAKTIDERADIPIFETDRKTTEVSRSPKSAEIVAESLFNYYSDNFEKNAPKWVSFGVTSLLEKGIVNPPTDSLLRSGFLSRESEKIHERIDPADTFEAETIDAEGYLKTRVSRDLIDERNSEITGDKLRDAKRDGMIYAIYSGARIDESSGKIIYSIPVNKTEEVTHFMAENDVDPDNQKTQMMSLNGFVSIVEAIKNDDKATEDGFKLLDWYFDTFGYKKHMSEFFDTIDAYQENADKAFGDKLDEYLARRKEVEEWKKQQLVDQDDVLSGLSKATTVNYEELISYIKENMTHEGDIDVFPIPSKERKKGDRLSTVISKHPTSIEKCTKAMQEIELVRKLDPNASFLIGTVFDRDERGRREKRQDYALVRFGYNGHNNVIAIHLGDSSRAIFCWRGKTGDNADGWREYFSNSSIRDRNTEIQRFVCRGYTKKGFLALNDQWERIWNYLNSPDAEEQAS